MRRHVTTRPLSLPTGLLTRLPFHHVGAALSLPDFCYTSPHHLAVVAVLILAPGYQPTCGAGASMGHVERGVRCCWGAVLCFCFCSALPCPALLAKIVCVCTVQLCLSAVPYLSVYALGLRLRLRGHPPSSVE